MSDTLQRQWNMLQMIPREPRGISVPVLRVKLADTGYPTTDRTLQRDLESLSRTFPLLCDESAKPYLWSWSRNGAVLEVPGIDPPTALTFRLVDLFITPLLPPSVRQHLEGHFAAAQNVLAELPDSSLPAWSERVLFIGRGPQLQAPEIPESVTNVVYDALLRQRRFRAHYRPRKVEMDAAPREYELSPLGLVVRDQVIYLVCTLFDYDDIRQVALHRMSEAELLDTECKAPEGFDLRTYVKEGNFDYPVGGTIQLEIAVEPSVARHLLETPLSDDQLHDELEDGRARIKATVLDSSQLRWWLLSFGAGMEVLAPTTLRKELRSEAERLLERYVEEG